MADEKVCVFCGRKIGFFRASGIFCAEVYQPACTDCAWELKNLTEEEQCRRALQFGLANAPEKLEKRIETLSNAEEHRPTCLQCGSKLRFQRVQHLDNSPMADGIFSTTLEVLPAVCENCGQYVFYNPEIARRNECLAHLIKQDNAE